MKCSIWLKSKSSLKILQKNLSSGHYIFPDKIYGTRSSEAFLGGGGEGGGVWWEGVSMVDELGKIDHHG